jgi:fructoselysine-6-phosphate deglycase
MSSFDADRYQRIQSGAVGLADRIDAAVQQAVDRGADRLSFLGAGGVGYLMEPAAQLLQQRSTARVNVDRPAELVARGDRALDRSTLAVIPSLSGTTTESVAVIDYLHDAGATVLALTGHDGTPVHDLADVALVNDAADDTSSENFYLQSLLVALSFLRARGELSAEEYAATIDELQLLPGLLVRAKLGFDEEAAQFASRAQDWRHHIFTGAGNTWPEAAYFAMCILEEMQWIPTRPVHASDFFHGTLELVEPGVSVVLLKGEDECRPLADRVEKFATTYTDRLWVLDSADVELPGISPATRAMVSPIVLAALLERVASHLEVLREHPLTTRRYYKRVAY